MYIARARIVYKNCFKSYVLLNKVICITGIQFREDESRLDEPSSSLDINPTLFLYFKPILTAD